MPHQETKVPSERRRRRDRSRSRVLLTGSLWLVLLSSVASSQAQRYDGDWSGTTGQGRTISFTVERSRIVMVSFTGRLEGSDCLATDFEFFENVFDGPDLRDGAFELSGGFPIVGGITYTLSGSPQSSSSASGSLSVTLHPFLGFPICAGTVETTWTASKERGGPPPAVEISVGDLKVQEGDFGFVEAVFEVRLSAPSAEAVTVDYTTTEGSADGGSDFIPISGTLRFDPGQTRGQIVVEVLGDTVEEGNETLFLDLSSPSNAILADSRGRLTILDDDDDLVSESCAPDEHTLCIDDQPGDRRFKVSVHYDTVLGGGQRGEAPVQPLAEVGMPKGGVFSFADPTNPELLVKVLRGCALNDRFWVFYSATTTVGFELTVEDTVAGLAKTYSNPDLNVAAPVTDTQAFATCP